MLESSFRMWRKRVTNVATKKLGQASTQTNYLLGALNPLIKLALIFQALRPSADVKPNTSNNATSPLGGFALKIIWVREHTRYDDPPNA